MMMISANQGANWEERGAVDVPEDTRDSDEHVIVERMDGTLWMLGPHQIWDRRELF